MSSTFFGRRLLGSSVAQMLRERFACNGLGILPQKTSESNIHISSTSWLIKQYVNGDSGIEEAYRTFRRRVVRATRRHKYRIEPSKERYICERKRYRKIKQKQFAQALDYVKILRSQEQEEERHRIKENQKGVLRNSILKEALSALRDSNLNSKEESGKAEKR